MQQNYDAGFMFDFNSTVHPAFIRLPRENQLESSLQYVSHDTKKYYEKYWDDKRIGVKSTQVISSGSSISRGKAIRTGITCSMTQK